MRRRRNPLARLPPGPMASASTQPYGYAPLRDQPGTSAYARAGAGANAGYLLGPGDKLHITVYGEDDLSGAYQIDGIGMVRLPLVGYLRAAGFTAPALENAIAGALAQGFLKSPRVNVEITEYRPFYIIGAVNQAGHLSLCEQHVGAGCGGAGRRLPGYRQAERGLCPS